MTSEKKPFEFDEELSSDRNERACQNDKYSTSIKKLTYKENLSPNIQPELLQPLPPNQDKSKQSSKQPSKRGKDKSAVSSNRLKTSETSERYHANCVKKAEGKQGKPRKRKEANAEADKSDKDEVWRRLQ